MISKSVAPFLALGSASLALAQDFIATTGVVAQNGSAPIRRNINELASEAGPQWDLYIQSLWEMQGVDESDPLSFFQIAGIHGWPFVEYNGTGPGRQNNGWMGYCPHGEPLFLSWHRPYVALYEQTLVSHAKAIAAKYPEDRRNEYVQAAESLRSPFWDWGTSRDVPQVTVPRSVTINTAEGKKEVQNPLMTYKFPKDAIDGKFGNFAQIRRTPPGLPNPDSVYRCAAPKSYPKSADEALELKVNRNRNTDLGAMVYDIFTNSQNFAQFASTRDVGMSLEQIHNTIHVEAACGADMMNQYVSGYDPLFMLHHTQVDRLWSYWQAIHPDMADFSGSYSGGARFTTPAGSTINQDSPLMPGFLLLLIPTYRHLVSSPAC
ncbi:hypothetical protein HIM_09748 [Hirsutella minnesotensis 3608]|uniref:Tyrosinase copper-binding domain-containing protein n=1 Tax=Hirsutella minnesotensis 3608 TaxID=1043627 RepID=A0A0F7ZS77_9HYPO|nr:hypothetical protein HIM_09748 [Hirsutella minnesotensis 3608]